MAVSGSGPDPRAGASPEIFDVRVVAWSHPDARTVDTLEELFGIDRAMAERLISSVPVIVKRGIELAEVETFTQALESIGAELVVERSGLTPAVQPQSSLAPAAPQAPPQRAAPPASLPRPPGPRVQRDQLTPPMGSVLPQITSSVPAPTPAPHWGSIPPSPMSESRVPAPPANASRVPAPPPRRPISQEVVAPSNASRVPRRPISQDIAIDLLGNDGRSGRSIAAKPARVRNFDDTEDPENYRRGVARRGQRDFDFDPNGTGGLKLDLANSTPLDARTPSLNTSYTGPVLNTSQSSQANQRSIGSQPASQPGRPREKSGPSLDLASSTRSAPVAVSPEARAAAALRPPAEPFTRRRKPWLIVFGRLVAGLAIVAGGLWFDDTILRGNASIPSLLLHAVAIYQLGLGARGALQ